MHNLVAVCRNAGMPAQAAFDHLGHMLQARYRDWYLALVSLPSWGKEIDSEVQNYIRGIQNIVKANLHWRFVEKYRFVITRVSNIANLVAASALVAILETLFMKCGEPRKFWCRSGKQTIFPEKSPHFGCLMSNEKS